MPSLGALARAWEFPKKVRRVLAARAATRFYHLRFSRKGHFEQGPRSQESSTRVQSVVMPMMLAFSCPVVEGALLALELPKSPQLLLVPPAMGWTTASPRPTTATRKREAGR